MTPLNFEYVKSGAMLKSQIIGDTPKNKRNVNSQHHYPNKKENDQTLK